jgi:hypothetical protein
LVAILFGLMLVWAQLLAAPTPACATQPAHARCHCGGKMSCCAAPVSSQPAPAVPVNTGLQKQFSISAPAIMAVVLPQNRAALFSSAVRSLVMSEGAPLYARDCARLI